jgi:hypothetical protein
MDAYTIFISAISDRFKDFALERYLECTEYSSAADNAGPPSSPNPRKLAKFHPRCA